MSACGHHNYSLFIIHFLLHQPNTTWLLSQTDKHIFLFGFGCLFLAARSLRHSPSRELHDDSRCDMQPGFLFSAIFLADGNAPLSSKWNAADA